MSESSILKKQLERYPQSPEAVVDTFLETLPEGWDEEDTIVFLEGSLGMNDNTDRVLREYIKREKSYMKMGSN